MNVRDKRGFKIMAPEVVKWGAPGYAESARVRSECKELMCALKMPHLHDLFHSRAAAQALIDSRPEIKNCIIEPIIVTTYRGLL